MKAPQNFRMTAYEPTEDAFYLALAEELAKSGPAEFLTFDSSISKKSS